MRNVSLVCLSITVLGISACAGTSKQEAPAKPVTTIVGGQATPASAATVRSATPTPAPIVAPAPPPVVSSPPPVAIAPVAPAPAPAVTTAAQSAPVGKGLVAEPGLYRCELTQTVALKRLIDGGKKIVIGFRGKDYEMTQVQSDTGALRFENPTAGYTWIMLANSAILLNSKLGQRVANQCKL